MVKVMFSVYSSIGGYPKVKVSGPLVPGPFLGGYTMVSGPGSFPGQYPNQACSWGGEGVPSQACSKGGTLLRPVARGRGIPVRPVARGRGGNPPPNCTEPGLMYSTDSMPLGFTLEDFLVVCAGFMVKL